MYALVLNSFLMGGVLSPSFTLFFIEKLNVVKFSNTYVLLDLRNNNSIKEFFIELEKFIITKIKESGIIKFYKLKSYSFIPLVNSYTSINDETFDVLKLNIDQDEKSEFATSIFYRYGKPIEDLNVMSTSVCVKTIFELISIVFDMDTHQILIDNCCRQLKVKSMATRIDRVKDIPYSFVDSDEQDSEDNESVNEPLLSELKIENNDDNENEENEENNDNENEEDNQNEEDNDDESNNENDSDSDGENEEDNKIRQFRSGQ